MEIVIFYAALVLILFIITLTGYINELQQG